MRVNIEDYNKFRNFLTKACGIVLGDNKQYLVVSRLRRILEETKQTLGELVDNLTRLPRSPLRESVIDAMTTNETLWFRDMHPFNILETVIFPEVTNKPLTQIKVWSAACSTGQEPYSISMVFDEYQKKNPKVRTRISIVGTDISPTVIDRAKKAEYELLAIGRGLSQHRLGKYFTKSSSGSWKVKQEITKNVEFRMLNLQDSYTILGKFDIIFCRNVLIYFSADLKQDILKRIHQALKPNGYLVLGASESLSGLQDKFEMIHCRPGIIYRAK